MDDNKVMNEFLQGVHMGSASIRALEGYVKDLATKKCFIEVLDRLHHHEQAITETILALHGEPNHRLKCSQKMVIMMCQMKAKKRSDFEITIYAIDAMQMGMQGVLRFLDQYRDLNPMFAKHCRDVLDDYDQTLTRFKKQAMSFLPPFEGETKPWEETPA